MQTYGLLYKQGHLVKNWQTRLFILSGGQLKYYVPGDTEAKGTIMLHHIKTVQAVTMRQNGFKIETQNKVYFCQAPDEMSLQAWMAALRPLKVGFLMKHSSDGQTWKKRWCIAWRSQVAFFESHTDTKERHSYILLRDCVAERCFAVDRSVFGHDNIFQVETNEKSFNMQAISFDDMNEWLGHIKTAIASRGEDSSTAGQAASMQSAIGNQTSAMVQSTVVESNASAMSGRPSYPTDMTGGDQQLTYEQKLRQLEERESKVQEREMMLEKSASLAAEK